MDALRPKPVEFFTPELLDALALEQRLPSNEIACSLRLVSKEAAKRFAKFKTITVTQGVPHVAIACLYNAPGHLHKFTFEQRVQLISQAATSGRLLSFQLTLAAVVRYLTGSQVGADAPGRLLVRALCEHGGYGVHDLELVLLAAATTTAADPSEVFPWMLRSGWPASPAVTYALAAQEGLTEELSLRRPSGWDSDRVLPAAAKLCDLATLQLLFLESVRAADAGNPSERARILAHAATSGTKDWQDKMLWLEGRGLDRTPSACSAVAGSTLPDAVERLAWLRARGHPLDVPAALNAACGGGGGPVVAHLLDELRNQAEEGGAAVAAGGPTILLGSCVEAAATAGNLAALKVLHARGAPVDVERALNVAVEHDRVSVVAWLSETFQIALDRVAARNRSFRGLAVPRWLEQRGSPVPDPCRLFGNQLSRYRPMEALAHWVAEGGDMRPTAEIYNHNMYYFNNQPLPVLRYMRQAGWIPDKVDLANILQHTAGRCLSGPTLRFLRDLGYVMKPNARLLTAWVRRGYSLCSLRWLVEESGCCPVADWVEALREAQAEVAGRKRDEEVVQWLRARVEQQQGQQG